MCSEDLHHEEGSVKKPFAFRVEDEFRGRHLGVYPTVTQAASAEGHFPTIYACFCDGEEMEIPEDVYTDFVPCSPEKAEAEVTKRIAKVKAVRAKYGDGSIQELFGCMRFGAEIEDPIDDQIQAYMELTPRTLAPDADDRVLVWLNKPADDRGTGHESAGAGGAE